MSSPPIVPTSGLRVFSAALSTETNTFAPLPTSLAEFRERSYYPAGTHPDYPLYVSGPLWAARLRGAEQGWTLTEGLVAAAQPSGITTRATYETLRDQILDDLTQALPVDVVLLGLHGAMVADGYDDCEGDLLQAVRAIVGPAVVIGAELDPHCHLSAAMTAAANLLITYKEYPHTDVMDRAFELVDLCAAIATRQIHPACAVFDCKMVCVMHTSRQPMRSFVDRLQALENQNGVLSISVVHGFPWGDVVDMGSKLLVYTDGNPTQAATLARTLGQELIALRETLTPATPTLDAALDEAERTPGTVVIADSADNPGGGAAGDATFMLRRLIERGSPSAALGPLWDPQVVQIAIAAGVGATLPLRIGGKVSPQSGAPIDLRCEVKAIRHGFHQSGLTHTPVPMGDCVLLEAGSVQIVVASLRTQAMNTDLFTGLGCTLHDKRLVCVKSSQHFYADFSRIAAKVLYASSPGTLTDALHLLPYRHVRRPKWPIDA